MKNIYLIICLFIFPYAVSAQNQSIDSLKKVLKIASQDTVKVNVLNNISTAFIQIGHFDSANRYTNSSVALSEKLHYKAGAVMAYHNLAVYNFHIKEYRTGKYFLLKSLNAALLTNDKKNIAADYKELSDLYQLQSNFKQAKESNRKFVLYSDSLAKAESAKSAFKRDTIANITEKEKVDLAANTTNKKTLVVNDNQNKHIIYISVGILLILLVFIIWFIINRARNKAKRDFILSDENAGTKQDEIVEKPNKLKDNDIEKAAFLQKITEIESQITNNTAEHKQVLIEGDKPVLIVDDKELVEGKSIVKPTTILVESETNDIDGLGKAYPSTIDKRYSNLIFSDQLSHFTAKYLEDTVKLLWKTGDEKNIARFEVEKSADGVQYVSIETLAAKGFGSNIYEKVDFRPLPGTNYYRLQVIDTDGNFIYSPIVQVEVLPVLTLTLICYPTYVKDVIVVTAAGGKLPISINIYNKAGKKEFTIETPPTTTPIYLTSLAAGTYTLQMKCQGKTILQQLIKAEY